MDFWRESGRDFFFGAFSRICLLSPSVSRLAPRVPQLQLQRCEGGGACGCIQLDRKGARCGAKAVSELL